jgi:hypothetical protein
MDRVEEADLAGADEDVRPLRHYWELKRSSNRDVIQSNAAADGYPIRTSVGLCWCVFPRSEWWRHNQAGFGNRDANAEIGEATRMESREEPPGFGICETSGNRIVRVWTLNYGAGIRISYEAYRGRV